MTPIFILGCDRSGTTFLGATLSKLDGVICLPESQFVAENLPRAAGESVSYLAVSRAFAAHYRFAAWREAGVALPDLAADSHGDYPGIVELFVQKYAQALGEQNPAFFVEHSPQNLFFAKRLAANYPQAYFIQIVRDGRAVAASIIRQDWGPNTVQDAAVFWMGRVAMGMTLQAQMGASRIITVRYEDLVAEAEGTVAELADFLSLPASCKHSTPYRQPSYSRNTHALVGAEPAVARISNWQQSLSPRQIEIFEAMAGGLLQTLGYSLTIVDRAPRRLFRREAILDLVADWIVSRKKRRLFSKRHGLRSAGEVFAEEDWRKDGPAVSDASGLGCRSPN